MQVRGWPIATILRGNIVMREDTLAPSPSGRVAHFA
jgi:dihydroorotase-like cyclic amidohydrolase